MIMPEMVGLDYCCTQRSRVQKAGVCNRRNGWSQTGEFSATRTYKGHAVKDVPSKGQEVRGA